MNHNTRELFLSWLVQVLNAGKNKLTRIDEVKSMTSLGALILNGNVVHECYTLSAVLLSLLLAYLIYSCRILVIVHADNNITSICKLDPHHQLNTLGMHFV